MNTAKRIVVLFGKLIVVPLLVGGMAMLFVPERWDVPVLLGTWVLVIFLTMVPMRMSPVKEIIWGAVMGLCLCYLVWILVPANTLHPGFSELGRIAILMMFISGLSVKLRCWMTNPEHLDQTMY